MAGNGGIIGPNKVINTPVTRTETFTGSGNFQKTNCTSNTILKIKNTGKYHLKKHYIKKTLLKQKKVLKGKIRDGQCPLVMMKAL